MVLHFFCEMKVLSTNFLFSLSNVDVDQKIDGTFFMSLVMEKGKGWLGKKKEKARGNKLSLLKLIFASTHKPFTISTLHLPITTPSEDLSTT